MHSILEGVIKRFFKAWFEDKFDEKFPGKYLKDHLHEINSRLMKIKPPSFVPCAPREISSWHLWRAHEFLVFLLYYCLPVLNQLMEETYYSHLIKLVVSLEALLAENILTSDLNDINNILIDFVKDSETLYGPDIMLSGLHELLHLVQCTRDFGPLNVANSFQFEENNRGIISFIHGQDLVGDEFLKVFSIAQALKIYVETYVTNPIVKEFLRKYVDIKSSNDKSRLNIVSFKLSKLFSPKNTKYKSLINDSKLLFKNIKFTNRILINGVIYTDRKNKSRFCDYCIQANNGEFGFIWKILVTNENKVYFLLKKIVKLLDCFYYPKYEKYKSKTFLCCISHDYFIATIDSVKKVSFIKINEELNFISTFDMRHLFH